MAVIVTGYIFTVDIVPAYIVPAYIVTAYKVMPTGTKRCGPKYCREICGLYSDGRQAPKGAVCIFARKRVRACKINGINCLYRLATARVMVVASQTMPGIHMQRSVVTNIITNRLSIHDLGGLTSNFNVVQVLGWCLDACVRACARSHVHACVHACVRACTPLVGLQCGCKSTSMAPSPPAELVSERWPC